MATSSAAASGIRARVRLLAPDTGTVQVGGTDVAALPRQARARFRATQVGFVFQSFNPP